MLTQEEKLKLDALHRQRDKELQDVLDEKLYKSIFGDTVRGNVRGVMYGTFAGGMISAAIGLAAAGLMIGLSPVGLGLIGGAVGTFIAENTLAVAATTVVAFGYKGSEIARSFLAPLSATAGAVASGFAHKEVRERAMEREKLLENLTPEQEEKIRTALAQTPMPQPEKKAFYHLKVGLTWGVIGAAIGALGVGAAALIASTGGAALAVPAFLTSFGIPAGTLVAEAIPALMTLGAVAMGSIGLSFGIDRSIFQRINFLSDHAATGSLGSVFTDLQKAKQLEPEISRYESPRPASFGLTDQDMKELSSRRHGTSADFRKKLEESRIAAEQAGPQIQ